MCNAAIRKYQPLILIWTEDEIRRRTAWVTSLEGRLHTEC